jgi:serine/threonine protein kinase
MQRNIQLGQYSMEPCEHLGLSAHVQDLIPQLLCVDPTQRLTADEALKHPWLKDV